MAIYTKLTKKQEEMLIPLEKRARENRKEYERINRKINFNHLFFDESQKAHDELKQLDNEYGLISAEITKIYAAEAEMMEHMKKAIAEVKAVDEYVKTYGFDVHI